MVETGQVEEQRVGRQADRPFAFGPAEVLRRGVVEGGGAEDALLAIADGTGPHAVVATDTGRELGQQSVHAGDPLAEGGEHPVTLCRPLGNQTLYDLFSSCGSLRCFETQFVRQSVSGLDENLLAGVHTEEANGDVRTVHVRAAGNRFLAHTAGGSELVAFVGAQLALGSLGQYLRRGIHPGLDQPGIVSHLVGAQAVHADEDHVLQAGLL